MYSAFIEVMRDLWDFVRGVDQSQHRPRVRIAPLAPLGVNVDTRPPYEKASASVDVDGLRSAYVATESANYLISPKLVFDGVIDTLEYGVKVAVRHLEDGYASVVVNGTTGWIDITQLSDDRRAVFPYFESGQSYPADHPETVKLRRCIKDECAGESLRLPLQSFEYIRYELAQRYPKFQWPTIRPRTPGVVHQILRRHTGVSMGIEPKTGSLLESAEHLTGGFFGIVETVQPDASLTVASVGRVQVGEFRREHFTHEEWKEWRPTFISLS